MVDYWHLKHNTVPLVALVAAVQTDRGCIWFEATTTGIRGHNVGMRAFFLGGRMPESSPRTYEKVVDSVIGAHHSDGSAASIDKP